MHADRYPLIDQLPRPGWLPHTTWPHPLRVADVTAGRLHYLDAGQGPTLLLVTAGTWSFVWRDVIAALSPAYRCVALDFPGSGLSPAGTATATLAGLSDVLEQFVDRLGLGPVTLVAHDLGGPVGLGLAVRRPGIVERLVLAQTFGWEPDRLAFRAMLAVMSGPPVRELGVALNAIPRLTATRLGVGRHLSRADRQAFRGPFRARGPRRVFHQLLGSATRSRPLFEGIERGLVSTLRELPVLTIFGERNDPLGFQDRWRAWFAQCEQVVVPGGNHFPMCDAPDLFAGALDAWCRRHPSPSGGAAGAQALSVAAAARQR